MTSDRIVSDDKVIVTLVLGMVSILVIFLTVMMLSISGGECIEVCGKGHVESFDKAGCSQRCVCR